MIKTEMKTQPVQSKKEETSMLTLRENMLLVYQHKIPEYLPLLGDIQRIRSVEPGFKNVLFHGKGQGRKKRTGLVRTGSMNLW